MISRGNAHVLGERDRSVMLAANPVRQASIEWPMHQSVAGALRAEVMEAGGMTEGAPSLTPFEAQFDALNEDQSHYESRNDICTPMGCVQEMVESVPKHFWKRPGIKVLDPCAGNGNFHAYIKRYVPLEQLFFNDINDRRIENIKANFGGEAKITTRDFLGYDENEQYDLIVSNPPYAKFDANGNRVSKNHNLSRAFIEKALRLTKAGGIILFIVPNNWMSFADRNVLPSLMSQYQFLRLNIHGAKRWFPGVGSSFTWFLLQKTRNRKSFEVENHYKWEDRVKASIRPGVHYIPL